MVAADQRQPERAGEQRARHARGSGGADVDRVERAICERLHGGGQAGHADLQSGVVGHVDLRDGRQAPVDLGVGADDLDLVSRHAAPADLLDRAGDAVRGADPVGEDRHARGLALAASRAEVEGSAIVQQAGELGLLAGQERGRRRVGDRRDAALEQALRGGHHLRLWPVAARSANSTAARSLRSCARHARRYRSEWLNESSCM